MIAFTAVTPVVSKAQTNVSVSSFTRSLETPVVSESRGARMALRVGLAKSSGLATSRFGGLQKVMNKADEYMAQSVMMQYYAMAQPFGVYSGQCTEGSVKGAAEVSRVRQLNTEFRERQKGPSAVYGSMYEYRLSATYCDHLCSSEAKQFSTFSKLAKTYCLSRAEAYGTCDRYATPESVEEAAMARYMDIQQKIAVNPSGVYNSACNEGSVKGQSEELRVNALAAAYRQSQKPVGVLLQEKYNQRKAGYLACHGCSYEEDIVSKFPAVGATFRLKSYGY